MNPLEKKLTEMHSWRPVFETSVGAVVFSRTAVGVYYLLLKYPHGHWDFVKGHREPGESDSVTLRRELIEETGIGECEVVPGFRETIRFYYMARGEEREKRQEGGKGIIILKKVIYYAVGVTSRSIVISDEHVDFNWLPFRDALDRITHENSKNVLIKADEIIKTLS